LFGTLSVSIAGYVAILALIALMAIVTALASRRTVNQTLNSID
jgi:cell division transport system permease protein